MFKPNADELAKFQEARAKAIEAAKRAKQADKLMGWPVVKGVK